jgi:tetratricopeptide (TPR) repeat protein
MRALLCATWLAAAGTAPACQAPAPPPQAQQPALQDRALVAERQGRFAEAAEAFLELARAEPRNYQWPVAAGRCLMRAGRPRDAIDVLDAARKEFPTATEVRSQLAQTFLRLAEDPTTPHPEVLWADAAELAEGVLRDNPDDEDGLLVLAHVRYLQGDWESAAQRAEEAVRRHPQRSGAHVLLGRIATDRFRTLLQDHERLQPTGQQAADLVAAIDAQRQLALRSYRRAAELEPERAFPHVALGRLAMIDQRTEQARQHLADALAIDPDAAIDHGVFDADPDWQRRREAYAAAGRRYAASAAAKPEKRATLHWYEGRALFAGGQWTESRQCFEAALAGNPGAITSHYYLALCSWRLDDHDAAEHHAAAFAASEAKAFADIVRALPGDQRGEIGAIVRYLADRAYKEGRIAQSRDLNHVIACLEDSADAWNNHAFLCRETGRFEDALASYHHAQEKEPDSPQLMNDTAVILHHHLPTPENLAKARLMYERALQAADKVLADGNAPEAARERARKARADAAANLAEMR